MVALVVAMTVFTIVNTLLLATVLKAAAGSSIRGFMADVWGLSGLMTIGSIGVGAVAVAIVPVSVWLLPITLHPAKGLW